MSHHPSESNNEFLVESIRATSESGLAALKALLLTNGGAAVAFLAFMGSAWKNGDVSPQTAEAVSYAMKYFLVGVACAVFGSGCTYLSNLSQSFAQIYRTRQDRWNYTAYVFMALAILSGLAAIVVFMIGGWSAADAFLIAPSL
jgi:hypothetical protein